MNPDEEFARPALTPETPKMVLWVMQYSGGVVTTEKQATYVLVGIAVVGILFTLFMLFSGGEPARPPVPSITGEPVEAGL